MVEDCDLKGQVILSNEVVIKAIILLKYFSFHTSKSFYLFITEIFIVFLLFKIKTWGKRKQSKGKFL